MSIAKSPSKITLPAKMPRWNTVFAFLAERFPHISESQWQQRLINGKVHWLEGSTINPDTPFKTGQVVCYYREVALEPNIPFEHKLLYQNEHFIIVDKPHFLQVTPGGIFVNECLLARLQHQLKQENIVPVHRLDRDTAGLVMFSSNPDSRAKYCDLFANKKIKKTYQAVANLNETVASKTAPIHWRIANRIEANKDNPLNHQFIPDSADRVNAQSDLSLINKSSHRGLFELTPHTGKTHQLRLHMLNIGMPILNDRFYPSFKTREQAEDYNKPLQLLAQRLSFTDPVTGHELNFNTQRRLKYAPV